MARDIHSTLKIVEKKYQIPTPHFDYIEDQETVTASAVIKEPKHIGQRQIRNTSSFRSVGNCQAYAPSLFEYIDMPTTCITSTDQEQETSSSRIMDEIRKTLCKIQKK